MTSEICLKLPPDRNPLWRSVLHLLNCSLIKARNSQLWILIFPIISSLFCGNFEYSFVHCFSCFFFQIPWLGFHFFTTYSSKLQSEIGNKWTNLSANYGLFYFIKMSKTFQVANFGHGEWDLSLYSPPTSGTQTKLTAHYLATPSIIWILQLVQMKICLFNTRWQMLTLVSDSSIQFSQSASAYEVLISTFPPLAIALWLAPYGRLSGSL